jgi:hypothetical protein
MLPEHLRKTSSSSRLIIVAWVLTALTIVAWVFRSLFRYHWLVPQTSPKPNLLLNSLCPWRPKIWFRIDCLKIPMRRKIRLCEIVIFEKKNLEIF